MEPRTKKILPVLCALLLISSILFGSWFCRADPEIGENDLILVSDTNDITTLEHLGFEIVERFDHHVLLRIPDDTVLTEDTVGSSSEDNLGLGKNIEENGGREEVEEFPGYDPMIHSMVNKTEESYIYDHIDTLQNFENEEGVRTRRDGTLGFWDSVDWTKERFESYGLEVYQQNFTYSGGESANVIAELPGSDPELKEETFIIGGHLDSINNRGAEEPAPGADDNGSGIAVTLEAARIMSEYDFDRTIRFAAWGAEELGLHGSSYYAENIDPAEEDLKGKFNYDMVGYAEDDDLAVTLHANEHSNWMLDYKADTAEAYAIDVDFTYVYDSTETRSDHSSFWNEGYDAMLAIETEFNPHYHTEDDTLDKLSIPQIDYTAKHAIGTVAHLAGLRSETVQPLPPTDPEPEDGAEGVSTDPVLSVYVEHDEGESMDVSFYDASNDLIGTDNDVGNGERASEIWNGLDLDTTYGWYAVADDGQETAESNRWSFTTMSEKEEYFDVEIVGYDEEIHEGDELTVNYTVTNTGEVQDTQTIEFKIDGAVEDSEEVTLQIDQEHEGHFTWMAEEEGTYTISVASEDDEDEVTVSVLEEVVQYELTIYAEEGGTTDPEPGTYTYEEGTEVELTASSNEGWSFVEWSGDETGTDTTIEITMDDDKEITALFEKDVVVDTYTLTVDVEGEGDVVVEPDQEEYEEGTEVELTASPTEGWSFVEWTGDEVGTDTTIEITMDHDKEVTALFEKDVVVDTYTLTVDVEGEGDVVVEPDQEEYEEGTEVELTASPTEGWSFVEWTGDHEGTDEVTTIIIDEDKEVNAYFAREAFFEVDILSPQSGEEFHEGDEVTVEYRVKNTGRVTGEQDLEFYANGVHVETEKTSLGPNESYQGEFTWEAEEEGEIEFEVRSSDQGETDTVSFTVNTADHTDDPGDPEDDDPFPWWILILLLAVVVSIVIVLASQIKKDDENGNKEEPPV